MALRTSRELPAAVSRMRAELPGFRGRVGRLRNRAVFEACDCLQGLLLQRRLRDAARTVSACGAAPS